MTEADKAARAMLAALEQSLWHWGADKDRAQLLDEGKGWKTDTFAAVDLIRASIAAAKAAGIKAEAF